MRAADFLGPWEEDQSARSLPRLMTHHWRRMLIVHLKTLTVKKTVRKKHFSNRGQWPESERVKYPGLWPVTRYKNIHCILNDRTCWCRNVSLWSFKFYLTTFEFDADGFTVFWYHINECLEFPTLVPLLNLSIKKYINVVKKNSDISMNTKICQQSGRKAINWVIGKLIKYLLKIQFFITNCFKSFTYPIHCIFFDWKYFF